MPRVYLPMTLGQLRVLHESGAVPDGVDRLLPASEDEEEEYAALEAAAEESGALLRGPGRRVVVVAEVEDADGPVPLRRVVAVHADSAPVDPADGDPTRLPTLGWWATQELHDLLAD